MKVLLCIVTVGSEGSIKHQAEDRKTWRNSFVVSKEVLDSYFGSFWDGKSSAGGTVGSRKGRG